MFRDDWWDPSFHERGENHRGVAIALSKSFLPKIREVSFHPCSSRIYGLRLTFGGSRFRCFAGYFPTSWDSEGNVVAMYDMVNPLLCACESDDAIPSLGGDFNSNLGMPQLEEDLCLVGNCGVGPRNEQGWLLSRWVGMRGLQILNCSKPQTFKDDNWTCRRAADGALVQLDFIVGGARCSYGASWAEDSFPIGLDHKCVICQFDSPGESKNGLAKGSTIGCLLTAHLVLDKGTHAGFPVWGVSLDVSTANLVPMFFF